MNQFLSNKIIAGIVALALLMGVGVLVSSGDTSSTTRNAALVVATPCTKPGQVTKVSKQAVVCVKTNTGSLWYATMKAKGKAQACTTPGEIRKKSDIVWVCGVIKKKKLWQATQPLPPAVASTTAIEPGATQPTPLVPIVADNTVLADPQIPDDKIVTQVIEDVTTTTSTPKSTSTNPRYTPKSTTTTTIPTTTTTTTIPTTTTSTTSTTTTTTIPRTYQVGETGPGGGIVFYVASTISNSPTSFTCGVDLKATCTYLEAAIANGTTPSTWKPGTTAQWGCKGTDVMTSLQRTASLEIGQGRANTILITGASCNVPASAASIAKAYNGGGRNDWFLPSRDELNELCKYVRNIGQAAGVTVPCLGWSRTDFDTTFYWSSSEGYKGVAWLYHFLYGFGYTADKNDSLLVRPVRAF